MSEKKSYKISILEHVYSLVSDESDDHLFRAARFVESRMQELMAKMPLNDPVHTKMQKSAVLGAIQLASSMLKLEDKQAADSNALCTLIERVERELLLMPK